MVYIANWMIIYMLFNEHIFQMGWFNHQLDFFIKFWINRDDTTYHTTEIVLANWMMIYATDPTH